MKQCKIVIKKLILTIVLISILIMFFATPKSNALLEIEDGDFYYAGSTEGSYKATGSNIFNWILKALGDVADFILGMLTIAPRMIFVGWTAIIEKVLTWAVESSAGVTTNGTVVENPTDLSAITESNGNITVEAIVYNKVAALNADIFDLELDRTISPTGHRLYCDKCETYVDEYGIERYQGKYVEKCCNEAKVKEILADPETYKDTLLKEVTIEDVPDFCSCKCGGKETCYGCSMYFEQLTVEKPTIILIKENIATWYYIIRMLAMAIMLVVLIAVGIKMAISTIASDKAVYKRMLVDWVVGVIMLFTLHYFMIFVIHMNAVLVDIVQENANAVNQEILENVSKDLETDLNKELAYKDLEIRVYEEIRSRAYDAKLSNGIIGMVMYMALVFMAVKYTVIYLKRLLTIMVLTLMAPGVGVAYALQKVLSGKSQALKTWMAEYIMNVIIQTVHAIIYAVFISQAMIMSLTNIAGMIVALVFLNYASKAEETFKKIFKFGGKDSLIGHTESAMQSMEEGFKNARGIVMGAAPAAKILTNTPYAKALKGLGKMKAVDTYQKISNKYNKSREKLYQKDLSEYKDVYSKAYEHVTETATKDNIEMDEETKMATAKAALASMGIIDPRYSKLYRGDLKGDEANEVRAEILRNKNILDPDETINQKNEENLKNYNEAKQNREKLEEAKKDGSATVTQEAIDKAKEQEAAKEKDYKQTQGIISLLTPSSTDAATKEFKKLLDIENQFNVIRPDGTRDEKNAKFSRKAFGTTTFDPIQMKFVNNNDSAKDKLFSEKLFGLTEQDKKMFKEHLLKPTSQIFVGMGSLFVGMGTIVTEPKIGMSLLATGVTQTGQARKKISSIKDSKDRYKFSRFSAETNKAIAKQALKKAKEERRKLNRERIKQTRPNFIENFKNGNIEAATLGLAASTVISPAITGMRKHVAVKASFFPKTKKENTNKVIKSIKTGMNKVGDVASNASLNVAEFARLDRAMDAANEVTVGVFKRSLSNNSHYSALMDYVLGEKNKIEKQFKKDAVTLTGEQLKAEKNHIIKMFDQSDKKELENKVETEGYDYVDSKKDILVRKESISKTDLKGGFKPEAVEKGKPSEKVIDEKLEKILNTYQQKGKLDLSSKGIQQEIVLKLEADLKSSKLINENQKIGDVFKKGEAGLIKVIKGKAGRIQEQKTAEDNLRATLTSDELKIVESSLGKMKKGASATERLAALSGILNNQNDGTKVVSGKDGTKAADATKTGDKIVLFGDEKKTQAIQSYVTAKYAPPKTVKSQKRLMAEILGSALEEYNSDSVPVIESTTSNSGSEKKTSESVLRDLYAQVKEISKTSGKKEEKQLSVGNKEFLLDQVQAEAATGLVRNLLEMMELNKTAVEMEVKDETLGYIENKKKKSSLAIQMNELEIRKLKIPEQGATAEQKKAKKDIEEEIRRVKILKEHTDSQLKMSGPIIDLEKIIGEINDIPVQSDMTQWSRNSKLKNDGSKSYSKSKDGSKKKNRKAGEKK